MRWRAEDTLYEHSVKSRDETHCAGSLHNGQQQANAVSLFNDHILSALAEGDCFVPCEVAVQ